MLGDPKPNPERKARKIVGKMENECVGFVVNVPSHTQTEKYFFPALGQEKKSNEQTMKVKSPSTRDVTCLAPKRAWLSLLISQVIH